ncbi:glycoside hydrolase family 57 protein [Vulcanisaeta distributa]|uniref:Alpha-amylase n=1 Tax=Vulcanisaeta distributa (strain DSM 14429 / JCM 11212 / NBRC 100878 / IC-017) TaxID=572478 RepID=E1QS76_VULDI|nr:glycoside hydrolase family 57 protein [Vulcanisaeta distributa]ADN51908.1 Alpha-amylase [Vulcanisaeta distributa DSM 14429]
MVRKMILFLEMHQPRRLRYGVLDKLCDLRGDEVNESTITSIIFNDEVNREILNRVADRSYIPTLELMKDLGNDGFRAAISISGSLIDQLLMWRPEVIDLLKELVKRDVIELVTEPYHHSLASFVSGDLFLEELRDHVEMNKSLFGQTPIVFENTEFLYRNDWGILMEKAGASVVLTEGVDWVLGWRSPTYLYGAPNSRIKLLLRHYRLSDDIGFRFSNRSWDQWPLTADKYMAWVRATPGDFVLVGLDFETFGEHHWRESGIFEFLAWLPKEARRADVEFVHPSSLANEEPIDYLDIPSVISWADVEKDGSAWQGNDLQRIALNHVVSIGNLMRSHGLEKTWKYLLTSDHYYYMSMKHGPSGEVHSYFNPYNSALAAFRAIEDVVVGITCALANVGMKRVKSRAVK